MKLNINPYFILLLTTAMFIISSILNHGTSMHISDLIEDTDSTYPSVFGLNKSDKMWIEKTLSEMSLYQKCAQMIMIPVYRSYMDTTSPDYVDVVDLVRNRRIGGMIMFQGELREEIEFIKSMQALTNIPLLVASDFERGLGSRIDSTLEFPHHMSLGATLNSQFAYEMGKAIAKESRLIGIHQNFAPVADINNNALNPVINVRSFSESKYTTANFVSSFVLGTKHGRVISTVKHFPGHGNTEIDSHTELPMINGEKKYLLDNELYPFIEAIRTGVQSIMVGHLEVPAYDTLPASLSNKVINDLLVNVLGFDGLIVTDALIMEGITKYYSNEEIVLLAVNAGNDIILMPPNPSEAISVIYKAVLEEKIREERIDKSVRKILSAKRWLENNSVQKLSVDSIVNKIESNDHLKLAEEIAASSITLVKNDRDIIPLDPSGYNNISCVTVTDREGDETAVYFSKILKNRIGYVDTFLLSGNSEKIEYSDVYNSVKNSDLIFLPLFLEVEPENKSEEMKKLQQNFIIKILKLKAPVIVISYKNPYLNFTIKNVKTYLNVYSYTEVSQSAALRAILGEEDISGKLPVSIPNSVYKIGYGISLNKTISTELSYSFDKRIQLEKSEKIINKVLDANRNLSSEICIGKDGKILYQKSFGTKFMENENNVKGTNINLGSLTIPIALTSSVMMLIDEGKLSLDDAVYQYIDINDSSGIGNITIKNLLLHNSGLPESLDSLNANWTKNDLLTTIINSSLAYTTGDKTLYSELNLILLQLIIEKAAGKSLDSFIEKKLYQPAGMKNTFYSIGGMNAELMFVDGLLTYMSYQSHKEILNYIMDGVTGYNNLYSHTNDMAKFAQMMLQGGYYSGRQYIAIETINEFTSSQLPDSYSALGWDTTTSEANVYDKLPINSYGINSPSGSSIWIDPDNKIFIIFLSDFSEELSEKLIPEIQQEVYEQIFRE